NGTALERFQRMVAAQGGDLSALPEHQGETPVLAEADGFVADINGLEVGLCGVALGAGRTRSDQAVDPIVGVRIDARRGAEVRQGDALATVLHGSGGAPSEEIVRRLLRAFEVTPEPPESMPLILERID
ncbi:MAG: thymidine phosphorylase, partial [Myxococcota bacterium]|nr:thymidine phosphorylase [Myxococcota bacterium]